MISPKSIGPIELKFNMNASNGKETNICVNGFNHMLKMAATLIYDKTPLKSSSPESESK